MEDYIALSSTASFNSPVSQAVIVSSLSTSVTTWPLSVKQANNSSAVTHTNSLGDPLHSSPQAPIHSSSPPAHCQSLQRQTSLSGVARKMAPPAYGGFPYIFSLLLPTPYKYLEFPDKEPDAFFPLSIWNIRVLESKNKVQHF